MEPVTARHPARDAADQGVVLPRRPGGIAPCGERRAQHGWCHLCKALSADLDRYRRENTVGTHMREWIIARDGGVCRACRCAERLTVDHDVPLSRGGRTDPDNLTALCRPCNSSKRDQTLDEWTAR